MDTTPTPLLRDQIQELLHATIRAYDVRENDAVSLKTLKLMLVGQVLEGLGMDWTYLLNLWKTHTPVHPDVARELAQGCEEEVTGTLAQIFVRNEKLVRLLKTWSQHGKPLDKILAVDGLGGNLSNGPNFDQKYYIGNLRYGEPKMIFDNDPECKRVHVQTVRVLYDLLENVPVPEKQIYEIVRYSVMEMAKVTLPEGDLMEEEVMDKKLQGECGRVYMKAMGKENIENLVKGLKRFRGEKRTHAERESSPGEKR